MSVNIVNGSQLSSDLEDIADAIRLKTGDANTIPYTVGDPSDFVNAIASIPSGGGDLDGTLDGTVQSITSGVTSLIPYALYGITSLTELNLPNVTTISQCALQNCTNAKVTFGTPLKLVGGSGLRSVYSNNVSDAMEVTFDYATLNSDRALGASGFTKVLGSFTSVGTYAFEGCSKLIEAHFNLKGLEYRTFAYCTSLADLYLENPSGVVTGGSGELQNVPSACKVHVPSFLLADYQASSVWNRFDLVGMTVTETILESMQSTGVGYLFTDIVPTANTGFEVKFVNKSVFSNNANTFGTVFGRQEANWAQLFKLDTYKASSYTGRVSLGNEKYADADLYEDTTTIQTCSYDATTLTYTSPKGNTFTVQAPTFGSNTTPIALFANATNSTTSVASLGNGMQIYYLKLYENGVLSHHLVPCKLTYQGDTTEIYCFKDTETDKYYQFMGETPTVTYNE